MTSVKSMGKKAVRKTTRSAVKGGVAWVKWAVGYAIMAAIGGVILSALDSIGIHPPFEAAATGTIAYLVAGAVFLHRKMTPKRLLSAACKTNMRI